MSAELKAIGKETNTFFAEEKSQHAEHICAIDLVIRSQQEGVLTITGDGHDDSSVLTDYMPKLPEKEKLAHSHMTMIKNAAIIHHYEQRVNFGSLLLFFAIRTRPGIAMNIVQLVLVKCVFLIGPNWAWPLKSRSVREAVDNIVSDDEMLLRLICQIGDGVYRHPYYCGKYLQCNSGMFTEKDCPSMMIYDVKIQACNFRRLVKCVVREGLTDYGDSVTLPPTDHHQMNGEVEETLPATTPSGPQEGMLMPQEGMIMQKETEPPVLATTPATKTTTTTTTSAPQKSAKKAVLPAEVKIRKSVLAIPQVSPTFAPTIPTTTQEIVHFMQPVKEEEDCVIWEEV